MNEKGQIQIADDVIATIAGVAAYEAAGVVFGAAERRNYGRNVKIKIVDGEATVSISISVRFNFKIKDVCEDVQKRVVNALETMAGLDVREVNVNVTGIVFEKHTKQRGSVGVKKQ